MEKESVKVLQECIELQIKKSNDYQNPNSRIKQSDYYPRGIFTITDICWAKMLRIYSVLEAMENDTNYNPNYESIEDSYKDLINYCSFAVSWIRGGIPGQRGQEDDDYSLLEYYKIADMPKIINYLILKDIKFKINGNAFFVKKSQLDNEGIKILCNNLKIELSKYQ